jgi:hypothetical protein
MSDDAAIEGRPAPHGKRTVVIALVAVAVSSLVYAFRPRPRAPDLDDEIVIGPDWHKPARPWSQAEAAQRSKIDGLEACRQENWQECYRLLLMAQADDPALETDTAVVDGIQDAVNALTDESDKYFRDHPGL